jgi:hypothetical protein
MYRMSILNKFKNSCWVLEKIQDFISWEQKSSRIHKECLNNFSWPKIFTTNTLCANVYKMYEFDKNQMPYCPSFGPLIKHGPHWINFTIFNFISENNRYFKDSYKIWYKIISFDMEKRVKCKISHGKVKTKWIWESLEWIVRVQMWYPNHAWTPYANWWELPSKGNVIKCLLWNGNVI